MAQNLDRYSTTEHHRIFPGESSYRKRANAAMISVLAQERLLGFAIGSVVMGIAVIEQRRYIHRTISDNQSLFAPSKPQKKEPIVAKNSQWGYAHIWNKAVDESFGPVIQALCSRGW